MNYAAVTATQIKVCIHNYNTLAIEFQIMLCLQFVKRAFNSPDFCLGTNFDADV